MKKIMLPVVGLAVTLAGGALAISSEAVAGGQGHEEITFCHYKQHNRWIGITTDKATFYKAGHVGHSMDIYPAGEVEIGKGKHSYVATWPARGDQTLLAYEDCQKPAEEPTPTEEPSPTDEPTPTTDPTPTDEPTPTETPALPTETPVTIPPVSEAPPTETYTETDTTPTKTTKTHHWSDGTITKEVHHAPKGAIEEGF